MKNLNQNETKGETSRLGVEPVATSQSGLAKLGKAATQVALESAAQAAPLATGKAAQAALKSRRHILLRLGPYSLRLGVRSLVVGLALLVVLTVVAVASVSTGAYPVSPAQVSAAIFGYGQEDNYARYFVTQVRAPRIATAMLVGAALGLSGALFQAVSGNPLGSPDIIGFTTGAATGALVAIILVGASPLGVSLGAIAGGVGAAALVYMLAWKNGITGNRLVLVGIGLAAVEIADRVDAKCIICPTHSGRTARLISNFRPHLNIVAMSPSNHAIRKTCFLWGVDGYKTTEQGSLSSTCYNALTIAKEQGVVNTGDLVVITAGDPQTSPSQGDYITSTNMTMVSQIQ